MHHKKPSARLRALTLVIGALFCFNAVVAQAQSGRRIPKRPTTADPTTPKESEPPVAPPEEKKPEKPALSILLAKHSYDIVYSSDIYLGIVMDGFLERVSKMKNIKVEPGGRDMNRKQAYDAAKAAPDRYVVWFQLVSDSMSSAPQSDYSYAYNLYIDYVVFTPGTGKTKTSGHVYQRTRGVGPVGVPVPGRTAVEYSLRYAGMELADRVLGSLDLDSPTTTPPTH
ncbi:MAG TPA: hypothetical protein VKA60_20465 [Blastocatellia bacterium]|nr:hypothetical protein [Blastocatellia bacterium]